MASTPIYNWPTPDNTGLVKNGALDMRTLGNAIDTTMATMTPKSLVDAKGDLIAATANDTPARLAVGANGETLVADSSTSTGLRYQGNFAAGKNAIINGDFNIWQRGTTFTNPSAGTFTADRYSWDSVSMTGSITRQAFTAGTAPVAGYEGTYFARLDITSGTQYGELVQKIENGRTFAGQTITVSFWARLNSGNSGWQVNVVQNFGTGGSPSSAVLVGQTAFTPTASWQRFTYTVAVPSVSGKTFGTNNNSFLSATIQKTSTAASQLDTWGWQVEASNTATAFQTATGTIQGELAACQRYYYRMNANGASNFPVFGYGFANTTGLVNVTCQFPVTMRTKPTTLDTSSVSNFSLDYSNTGVSSLTSLTIDSNYTNSDNGLISVAKSAAFILGQYYRLSVSSSVAATIGWSAEL